MPDAAQYGDAGSDTLGNIARIRGIKLPNLARLGLGNIMPLTGIAPAGAPAGAYGKCTLASPGKDTTTGHWEMVGIHLAKPFPLYPHGFPPDVMSEFERRTGRRSLGNKAASGTEIIKELGVEHMRTGSPIVYTSADSVFQIAAHEEVIPLWELYKMCETAREILRGPHEVGRVIARPFTGAPGSFVRTSNRHDYAVPPPKDMLLDQLHDRKVPVHSVGKIFDVFLGRGILDSTKTKNNTEGMAQTLEAMQDSDRGMIFVNLVDFDQQYGHRNDIEGYGAALEQFDAWVPEFESRLGAGDLAIFTADHGCDPTTPSTDHSREYVPLLVSGPKVRAGVNLGVRGTLSDIGQTVAENFGAHIAQRRELFTTNLMRTPVMSGNWKMYKTPAETTAFFEKFRPLVEKSSHCEIVICPPFTNLAAAVDAVKGSNIRVGAQNIGWAKEGAFTGEISGPMLLAVGASHTIIGHSERRQYFNETDETVLKRTQAALEFGLTPIVCVGELLADRESGNTEAVLAAQFQKGIAGLTEQQFAKIVIAYEPVWAIGTGKTATPEIAADTHRAIRAQVRGKFGKDAADSVRILYGGSVKPDNAKILMAQPEIDGVLVGGAALDPVSFASIVNF